MESGAWEDARQAFQAVLDHEEDAAALDGLAYSLWWLNDLPHSQETHERAYAAYRRAAEPGRAASVAMWLSAIQFLVHGNATASRGWLARAERLLEPLGRSIHHGWLEIYKAAAADPVEMGEKAATALAIAEDFGDVDLQVLALAYSGLSKVSMSQVSEGMAFLEEALAAATAGEMRNHIAIGLVLCVMLTACHRAVDLERAKEWAEIADSFLRKNPSTSFFATCRAFYGSVLTATGRWDEAEEELLLAAGVFARGYRAMRTDALVKLADLRLRQGRFEEAEELLRGNEEHPEAVAPLSALFLAQGRPLLARASLERRLRLMPNDSLEAAPLLALLSRALVELGEVHEAGQIARGLGEMGRMSGSAAVIALAARSAAEVATARGEDALPLLEEALALFAKANLPFELAEARMALARCLADRAPEVAISEASLAMTALERLGARRQADEAAELLRRLGVAQTGPKGRAALTKREAEVLHLLGRGLTNKQIAERLVISPRTAEHHVGNVLAKLGLATRAEAAAYAVRAGAIELPRH